MFFCYIRWLVDLLLCMHDARPSQIIKMVVALLCPFFVTVMGNKAHVSKIKLAANNTKKRVPWCLSGYSSSSSSSSSTKSGPSVVAPVYAPSARNTRTLALIIHGPVFPPLFPTFFVFPFCWR